MPCIFCEIINKEKPTEIIHENDNFIVIKDIKPSAPVHLLVIPKKHIDSVAHLTPKDEGLMGEMILTAQKVAQEKNLNSYRLRINTGKGAGQIVDHLHMHIFSW
ncbi:MAG: histidine triad nucleotide-binding protein [Candidatus Nealsonbacteria bacterium RBG_13_37_56]|uniref:Histidine triad nucleotide-binding protein n=1 Tax=Candidatus Nealsonbacteria bacterium RBG_13_37_56 TaxID=1801661 RepID=A0A1G2DXF6_9BACT|nr:MAG: histidine triad nucleotide-binding protein [Candidatus Nealsonbacteria bacterium RBG_13_37_56]